MHERGLGVKANLRPSSCTFDIYDLFVGYQVASYAGEVNSTCNSLHPLHKTVLSLPSSPVYFSFGNSLSICTSKY